MTVIRDKTFIDEDERRVKIAQALLAGYDEHAPANAKLAVVTAEQCDATKDDVLVNASNYKLFIESELRADFSREYLTRFCLVVEILRRRPRPTMH